MTQISQISPYIGHNQILGACRCFWSKINEFASSSGKFKLSSVHTLLTQHIMFTVRYAYAYNPQ